MRIVEFGQEFGMQTWKKIVTGVLTLSGAWFAISGWPDLGNEMKVTQQFRSDAVLVYNAPNDANRSKECLELRRNMDSSFEVCKDRTAEIMIGAALVEKLPSTSKLTVDVLDSALPEKPSACHVLMNAVWCTCPGLITQQQPAVYEYVSRHGACRQRE